MSLTILDKIKAYKLQGVAADKALKPLTEIESEAREASPPRGFATALIQAASAGYGLIAEVKKASPSKGLIRADFDAAELARAYETGGGLLPVDSDGYPEFSGCKIVFVVSASGDQPAGIAQRFHV